MHTGAHTCQHPHSTPGVRAPGTSSPKTTRGLAFRCVCSLLISGFIRFILGDPCCCERHPCRTLSGQLTITKHVCLLFILSFIISKNKGFEGAHRRTGIAPGDLEGARRLGKCGVACPCGGAGSVFSQRKRIVSGEVPAVVCNSTVRKQEAWMLGQELNFYCFGYQAAPLATGRTRSHLPRRPGARSPLLPTSC